MHRAAALLLLSAALCAPGACFAQADAPGAAATADAMPSAASRADPRTDETRSAFGRVMAVMISALQRQASAPGSEANADPVRTTAAGTPLDIEVGAAFSDAMRGAGDGADGARGPQRQPSAEAAEARMRTARPSELALRQAALAGPD